MGIATAPYRIETERLVIRCYDPAHDAPLLKEAVDSSIEHLLPWMPWARFEPQSVDEKVQLLRMFRGQFDLDQNYVYGIFSADETEQLGGTGLHPRSNEGSLEIGYWVAAGAIGQGIATEVTAVLTRAGFELAGLDRVDIQVEPT
ncbi:MAG TPA: GNAT family N-acetyltransferase, partial [Gaiellaceae bacterium]|nr:GNAT family N-acetyltransferase [Gaiellaceae bacterium]